MADKSIGDLPQLERLQDDSLLVVEQNGEANKLPGSMFKQFAKDGVAEYVESAKQSAKSAEESVARAEDVLNSIVLSEEKLAAAVASAEESAISAAAAAQSAADNAADAVEDRLSDHVEAAEAAEVNAKNAQVLAENAVGKTSYIGDNGNWYEWDAASGTFVDSGVAAHPIPYVQPNEPTDAPEFSIWIDTDEEAIYIPRAEGVGF